MHQKKTILVIILLFAFAFFSQMQLFEIAKGSKITYVNVNGGSNYTTIQEAIDNAESGDTIYVYSGTYNENIIITKNIILTGENRETTIIDGQKNDHVIYANGTDLNPIGFFISGFTVKNAGGEGNDCIALSNINECEISNNIITNSDESDGIQIHQCTGLQMYNNQITNNDKGLGILMINSQDSVIYQNTIQNNQKGIELQLNSNNNKIYENIIAQNSLYGIHLRTNSNTNIFYLNDFTENGENAYDSLTNTWSLNTQGNYWDDYAGSDSNSDGIGDTPYSIPGGDNLDEYPLGYFPTSNQKPIATIISVNPTNIIQGEPIHFYGIGEDSDGNIQGYNWRSSRDDHLSSEKGFSTNSLSIGTHTIYFKVRDDKGEWSTEKTIQVIVSSSQYGSNQRPIALILAIVPNPAQIGQAVSFNGMGVDNDEGGYITGFQWREEATILSTAPSFSKSNFTLGSHIISFMVKDNNEAWSEEANYTLTIIHGPPTAISGGPYNGTEQTSILFNGTQSYVSSGKIESYQWNFSDGTILYGESVEHTFDLAGNYTVTLIVTDNLGTSGSDATDITISSKDQQQDTPGFELIIIICALGIIMLWIKRKR